MRINNFKWAPKLIRILNSHLVRHGGIMNDFKIYLQLIVFTQTQSRFSPKEGKFRNWDSLQWQFLSLLVVLELAIVNDQNVRCRI